MSLQPNPINIDGHVSKPATWGKRLPCPNCETTDYLVMMNYDGWFHVECHAGTGCNSFGPGSFRKDAVQGWNDWVSSQCQEKRT